MLRKNYGSVEVHIKTGQQRPHWEGDTDVNSGRRWGNGPHVEARQGVARGKPSLVGVLTLEEAVRGWAGKNKASSEWRFKRSETPYRYRGDLGLLSSETDS